MISLQIVSIILVVHFLADFALQTDEQAKAKATDSKQLLNHVLTYTAVWFFISFGILGTWYKPVIFAAITGYLHYITDKVTSREVKKMYEKGDTHNMFVIIGADQILHYAQLFLTYLLLVNAGTD